MTAGHQPCVRLRSGARPREGESLSVGAGTKHMREGGGGGSVDPPVGVGVSRGSLEKGWGGAKVASASRRPEKESQSPADLNAPRNLARRPRNLNAPLLLPEPRLNVGRNCHVVTCRARG